MKDAKLAPDLELVMDQVVGIGLGEEPANPALDDRLQALAAQQGTQWEPSPSPDDSPEQPNSAQVCFYHSFDTSARMLLYFAGRICNMPTPSDGLTMFLVLGD